MQEDTNVICVQDTNSFSELSDRLLKEEDSKQIDDIANLFNLMIKKKEIIRVGKLSELQDKITEQMEKRLTHKADEFNNQDLLGYFKTIQDTIGKSDIDLEQINKPSIQINQQQLNINVEDTLSRESKEKVISALKSIFDRYSTEDFQNSLQDKQEEDI